MKNILSIFLLGVLLFSAMSLAGEYNATMQVSADVVVSSIGIKVPNSINFGKVSSGYLSNRTDINITNIGTTDIEITPQIQSDNNEEDAVEIFGNLAFRNILDDPLVKIGEYSLEMSRPANVGGNRTQRIYMYLDLLEYKGDVKSIQTAEIVFWVTEI